MIEAACLPLRADHCSLPTPLPAQARHAALKAAEPWQQPSAWEVQASVDMLAAAAPPTTPAAAPAVAAGDREAGELADAPAVPVATATAAVAAPVTVGEEGGEIEPAAEEPEAELCLVFLVDGSGAARLGTAVLNAANGGQ